MYQITKLKNGLKIGSLRMKQANSISLGVWIKAGGRYEELPLSGISHFIEHMVFKGTHTRSCQQIKEEIEGAGGLLNAFTSEEVTCFYVKILAKYLERATDVLLDMVLAPAFSELEIQKERRVIFEEIKMYCDLPLHLAHEKMLGLIWPKHPLGKNLAGNFASLKRIKRKNLTAYKDKFYNLDNMLICACGNIEHKTLVDLVERLCLRHGFDRARSGKYSYLPVPVHGSGNKFVFTPKKIEQTNFCLGFNSLDRNDPMRYALIMLHIILGGNMSSRLFNELRENRGYAYDIGTMIKKYDDCGAFLVHAGVKNENILPALKVVVEQLEVISKEGITDDELRRAREYFTGQLLIALEDTGEHMLWLSDRILSENLPLDPQAVIREIEKVSRENIRQVGEKIFKNAPLFLSVVGPQTNAQCTAIKNFIGSVRI